MVTEIDLLTEGIPRLEKKFGAGNPFVELLKAQLAYLQNQTVHQPQKEQRHRGVVSFKKSHIRKRNETSNKHL